MAIESISSTASSSTTTSTTTSSSGLSADDFLQILAAELQYQDPTEGVDSTQYISQLAQLTVVEQLEALNTSFSEMMTRQDLIIGGTWIGKTAAIYEEDGSITTGTVEGFVITDDGVEVYVDGNQYSLDQIGAIAEETETETESTSETETSIETETESTSETETSIETETESTSEAQTEASTEADTESSDTES